jgi:hypothetical protein
MARVWKWTTEDGTLVTASMGIFGRITLAVDGQEVARVRSGMSMATQGLKLRTTEGTFHYGSPLGVGLRSELRINGKLLLPTQAPRGFPTALTQCPACKAALRQGDAFCESCGKALPSAEALVQRAAVVQGNSAVGGLSILFLLSGGAMYAAQRSAANKALEEIAGYAAEAPLAAPIPGVAATTFGELRTQIEWEATSVLLVNLVLAAVMFGLWRWGKQKPGPAIIVAFCTFVVVLVTNAALDPKTIAQGWIVKFIVITYLVRGLKAALAERSSRATAA